MNQALIARAVAGVMPAARATGLFVSLCVFTMPDTGFDPSGTPDQGSIPVPGLVDHFTGSTSIGCMDAPPSDARIQATEAKDLEEIASKGFRHMLLNDYYPEVVAVPATPDGQIPTNWTATVDGVQFNILGVEKDSQFQMTRLELELVNV